MNTFSPAPIRPGSLGSWGKSIGIPDGIEDDEEGRNRLRRARPRSRRRTRTKR